MQELMIFEDVVELLELDVRDEKRNRLLLGAVTEEICLFLDRNLIAGTTTESHNTCGYLFLPQEYPVREITKLIDENTGETLELAPAYAIKDIARPDAHREKYFKIAGEQERKILIEYRYGYEQTEMPALIQAAVLEMMSDRLIKFGHKNDTEIKAMEKERLMNIAGYRRLFVR